MAPPTTYTDEIARKVLDLYAAGSTLTDACEASGTNYATFWEWCDRNEGGWIAESLIRAKKIHNRRIVDELRKITNPNSDYLLQDSHGRKDTGLVKLRGEFNRAYLYLLDRKTYGDKPEERPCGIDLTGCKSSSDTLKILTERMSELSPLQIQILTKVIETQQKTEEIQAISKRLDDLEKNQNV